MVNNGGVNSSPPAPASDAGAAEWIAPRLTETFGAVCRTIPTGFAAYARILHPADPGRARQLRWADVAAVTGRTMHRQAQFARIASLAPGRTSDAHEQAVHPPATGDLAPGQLAALCRLLKPHTPDGMNCWFAVWAGWGELNGSAVVMSTSGGADPQTPAKAPVEWQLDLHGAQFDLPGRQYYLFVGALDEAMRIGRWPTRTWFLPRSPNMFWPDDQRWCVATEVDVDSTLVAGSANLIQSVLADDDLEAWQVNPDDCLAAFGDSINQP